jgi:hypothetical protein
MMRLTTLSFSFFFLASAAMAAPVTYVCDVRPSDDGWIPAQITATFDTAAGRAAVQDRFTEEYNNGRPVEARFRERRNGRLLASWSLGNIRSSRGARRLSWSLELTPSSGDALVRAHWDMVGEGAQRPPTTRGTCRVVDGPNLLG